MIGHYLLTLTPEQENRVLTMRMGPTAQYVVYNGLDDTPSCGCLKGVVHDYDRGSAARDMVGRWYHSFGLSDFVGIRYDDLCARFGVTRVNQAIRNRILSNRARRVLADVQAEATLTMEMR